MRIFTILLCVFIIFIIAFFGISYLFVYEAPFTSTNNPKEVISNGLSSVIEFPKTTKSFVLYPGFRLNSGEFKKFDKRSIVFALASTFPESIANVGLDGNLSYFEYTGKKQQSAKATIFCSVNRNALNEYFLHTPDIFSEGVGVENIFLHCTVEDHQPCCIVFFERSR
ncbi:MAG: hypothetical protein HOE11_02320 [Candidatus Diapherotrites archaeon]|jgi:hypothetical protein|nr:hypothetical protein [Candidatus Diapherotrites archaeon]MBT4596965.1 hypothetical protein [Candidatus Diapherotrites archaeon]